MELEESTVQVHWKSGEEFVTVVQGSVIHVQFISACPFYSAQCRCLWFQSFGIPRQISFRLCLNTSSFTFKMALENERVRGKSLDNNYYSAGNKCNET
jgi:hypothetical protein